MMMEDGIEMETIFGDGSGSSGGGIMGKLMGAGKRMLTGESLFMTTFTNTGSGKDMLWRVDHRELNGRLCLSGIS